MKSKGASRLRQKAEELVKKQQSGASLTFSEENMLRLIHELQVHQLELELQNEELTRARQEEEQAKKKYTSLFKYAPSAYFILTTSGNISELNQAGEKMLGKERRELINSRLALFISPVIRKAFADFLKIVATGKSTERCEVIFESRDGIPVYARLTGTLTIDGMFCQISADDITDLVIAKETAQQSDRLKSAFLANMSHEIRTPMNGILGFAELLKEPGLNTTQQQEYIEIIEKSGSRMLNIINDIVDISKIEAGMMKLDIKGSNIFDQINYIYTFFKPEVEAKGMKFCYNNPLPENEIIINTDREKLFAILTNLVKNAIRFTDKGMIEIGYKEKSGALEFFVKDTGIGIPKDRQEAIFERFVQADIEDRAVRQGSGLGLAISRSYIEMLGGKIWVESKEGIGSTFFFTLPQNTDSATETTVHKHMPSGKAYRGRKIKILLAEDDGFSEILLQTHIGPYSKKILKARTGREATEICRSHADIDMIMMDIRMPEMDGYEATRQIRGFNKSVIIIAQTAYGLMGARKKAIEAGCNDYIAKPINKDKLHALMQKYLRN